MAQSDDLEGKLIRNQMTIKSRLPVPARPGGLLICGTNYGLPPGCTPTGEKPYEKPWLQYITDPVNMKGDKYVNRLMRWFEWWHLPLLDENGNETQLNATICQTNIFFDVTSGFELRTKEKMELAFERLTQTVDDHHISGILITSAKLADQSMTGLKDPKWEDPIKGNRFWLKCATAKTFRVAICPHPCSPQSRNDVQSFGDVMQKYICDTTGRSLGWLRSTKAS